MNTVRRVTLKGGLIGALSGESQGRALERVVGQLNEEGYRVTFILPDQWNPFKRLLAFLALILTLLLYTFSQNVLVIGERIDR